MIRQRICAFLVFLLILLAQSQLVGAVQTCSVVVNSTNTSYNLSSSSCSEVSIIFKQNISASGVVCRGSTVSSASSVVAQGNDSGIYLRNCTLDNPQISLANRTSLYVIGSDNATFTPVFAGPSSNITVAHYLRINVFQPFGHNASVFGNRAAGFSYIFPLMNNTFNFRNTELQMNEFFGNFTKRFYALANSMPFGTYNMSQSDIEANYTNASYGVIKGAKVFIVPEYTLSKNKRIMYNPYEVDYSFLEYDQLVMFRLNITRNVNLTPIYIAPIFPPFNFDILPDNGTNMITIKYLVAVPPQDSNWNFTAYLYRYAPTEFVLNPVSKGVGPHSALLKALTFPSAAAYENSSGTRLYLINYTTTIALGINSSIMTAPGYIPGLGSFTQDSTTPSFSFGLGYCAIADNLTVSMNYIVINRTGTYSMVKRLLPIAEPALPQLVNTACTTGVVISGSGISINCHNGTINDTQNGIIIENSTDISISNCNINGNGVTINNSTGISISNLTLTPSEANGFGISIRDAHGVNFHNLTIKNGYNNSFSVFSSAGTPFSEAISVYNLSICGTDNLSAVQHFAYVYSSRSLCTGPLEYIAQNVSQSEALILLTLALVLIYAFMFTRLRRRAKRRRSSRLRRRTP